MSAYYYFCKETKNPFQLKYPNLNQNDIYRLMSENWGKMSQEEQYPYHQMAKQIKQEYEKQRKDLKKTTSSSDSEVD